MTAHAHEGEIGPDATPARRSGRPRRRRRWLRRGLLVTGVLALVSVVGGLIFVRTKPFGASPVGDRQARIEQSPQWRDGKLSNPQPQWLSWWKAATTSIFDSSDLATPNPPLSIAATDTELLAVPPAGGMRVTWFGHSSTLLEIDGVRILFDPFWGAVSGPTSLLGAQRFYPAPAALEDIGKIDAVLISHDHWDHLDQPTISAMAGWAGTTFVVPLGIGAHLERWGIPSDRIRELDWWETTTLGQVEVVSTPARHSSGRDPLRNNETLWSGWALRGPRHSTWYSGDSGYFPDIAEIGKRLGPFDVTLLDAGQYDPHWPDNHLGPELAVQANALVGGKLLIPVHWALFNLAPHNWTEPVERVRAEAECRVQPYLVLVPGVPTEPTASAVTDQRQ
jgi:L-ascorbate metabolism protein UlaG (beta-lactamase superfamily)